jgi:hypothetical protein
MSALLFIRDRRRAVEKIDFVSMVRLAINGSKRDIERAMERWAKEAEINLRFED